MSHSHLQITRRNVLQAGILAACELAAGAGRAAPPNADASPMRAMWVYRTADLLASAKASDDLLRFSKSRRITDLFLQAHFVSKATGGPFEIADATKVKNLLRDAAAQGIRVHALAGDPMHTLREHHGRVLGRVEALAAFNKSAAPSARFAGLHFDIEPHALPAWKTGTDEEKCALLTQFVEVNVAAAELLRARAPGVLYGTDIVFWLDKVKADGTPAYPVTFRGVAKDAAKHLLDVVDNVGIMSYRDTAEGPNGIISLVEKTIAYADNARGRAFIGVKMADIGPKMEGFFGHTEQEMDAEVLKVEKAYGSHRGYAGIAYFMYEAYKAMPQKK